MTIIGLSYSLVKRSTKCAPALGGQVGRKIPGRLKSWSTINGRLCRPILNTRNTSEPLSIRPMRSSGTPAVPPMKTVCWSCYTLVSERWTLSIQNWNLTLSQLSIHFPVDWMIILTYDRLTQNIEHPWTPSWTVTPQHKPKDFDHYV